MCSWELPSGWDVEAKYVLWEVGGKVWRRMGHSCMYHGKCKDIVGL